MLNWIGEIEPAAIASFLSYAFSAFLALYWLGLAIRPISRSSGAPQAVSILIAAHNAENNISALLQSLARQVYKAPWEVIIALDRCTDRTRAVIESYAQGLEVQVLEINEVPPSWAPKKYALWRAAQVARYTWCVIVDADVWMAPDWLGRLMEGAQLTSQAVIGYAWLWGDGSLSSELAAYEASLVQLESIGRAKWRFPYMSTGRGWAVRRAWLLVGLYAWREVISGDDDLTLQLIPSSGVRVSAARSWSWAPTSFATAYRRKWRHLQTARHYRMGLRLSLAVAPILQMTLLLLALWTPWVLVGMPVVKFLALAAVRAPKPYVALWADWVLILLQILYPIGVMRSRRQW
ncbi:MAG: glycosyltransferase [Bacteroidia bacterium]